MRVRWLGWAGAEIEVEGHRVVIDPLQDAGAVFAWYGGGEQEVPLPGVVAAEPGAVAGLITHLHRDHADAGALAAALGDGARVYEPAGGVSDGPPSERLAIAQADHELDRAGLARQAVDAWASVTAGPFTLTALPAVDGTGDPQVSWLIEAGGRRVLHLGDTMFHGWWWRISERFGTPDLVLAPINGARVAFPHRQPASALPAVMDPEQAALAAALLRAERLVPIHHGGYDVAGLYEPATGALDRLRAASERAVVLEPGGEVRL